jgi:hypothetical protein
LPIGTNAWAVRVLPDWKIHSHLAARPKRQGSTEWLVLVGQAGASFEFIGFQVPRQRIRGQVRCNAEEGYLVQRSEFRSGGRQIVASRLRKRRLQPRARSKLSAISQNQPGIIEIKGSKPATLKKAKQLHWIGEKSVHWGMLNVLKVSLQTTIRSLAERGWSQRRIGDKSRNGTPLSAAGKTGHFDPRTWGYRHPASVQVDIFRPGRSSWCFLILFNKVLGVTRP